ncbi:MAG: xylulokinase [Propionibacteriaceae bacterium]
MVEQDEAGHSPTEPLFLGIDLGTSSIKAVLTDGTGRPLRQAVAAYPVESPHPAWAETDPELWWSAITDAVGEVSSAGLGPIRGIGLSGQMHGVVATDDRGRALRPAMLWADFRATEQIGSYGRLPAALRARLANPLVPGMAGPMLAWLAANEPTTFGRTRWALQPKDWVRARLTGRIAAEPSDASATLLYDVSGDRWDVEVVGALGLDPELLPTLHPHSGATAGTLSASTAEQLGLPPGIPVAAGAADAAAALLGSGLTADTDVQVTIGTGVQIVVPAGVATIPSDPDAIVTHLYRTATRRGWYRMAAVQSGGLTLSWVLRMLGASWAELYASATTTPRLDDPIFLPHLNGERTPYLDPTLRGAWTGLALRHDRVTLLRATLEGVAFTIAEALDNLPGVEGRAKCLRLAGGGSTDPGWRQMLADILGYPLHAVQASGASGRGAALLGACAAGALDEPSLPRLITPDSRLVADPSPDHSDLYAERRLASRQVLVALRPSAPPQPAAIQQRSSDMALPPHPVTAEGTRHP